MFLSHIHVCLSVCLSVSLSIYICISLSLYIYVYVYIYLIHTHIYTYIHIFFPFQDNQHLHEKLAFKLAHFHTFFKNVMCLQLAKCEMSVLHSYQTISNLLNGSLPLFLFRRQKLDICENNLFFSCFYHICCKMLNTMGSHTKKLYSEKLILPAFSEYGPQISNINITWESVRTENLRPPPQT